MDTLRLKIDTGGIPAGEVVISISEAADRMGVVVSKVLHLLRKGHIVAVRVHDALYIPELFFNKGGGLNKFVPGVLSLLSDGGYSSEEILVFLFQEDSSLPGRPVDALHGHMAREVMRRAQAMAIG